MTDAIQNAVAVALQHAHVKIMNMPESLALAKAAIDAARPLIEQPLREAIGKLLACPDLNLDELEPVTREAIQFASSMMSQQEAA
jgi:hypothetical protein